MLRQLARPPGVQLLGLPFLLGSQQSGRGLVRIIQDYITYFKRMLGDKALDVKEGLLVASCGLLLD